jgi:hypothetical protein
MLCHYCACNCGVEISVFVTSVNACSLCSLSFTSLSRDKTFVLHFCKGVHWSSSWTCTTVLYLYMRLRSLRRSQMHIWTNIYGLWVTLIPSWIKPCDCLLYKWFQRYQESSVNLR